MWWVTDQFVKYFTRIVLGSVTIYILTIFALFVDNSPTYRQNIPIRDKDITHKLPDNVTKFLHSVLHQQSPADRRNSHSQPWKLFINNTQRSTTYNEDYLLELLLSRMRHEKLLKTMSGTPRAGKRLKLFLELQDGSPIIAKFRRMNITEIPPANISMRDMYQRFQGEVAAFHLHRILGINSIIVPPVVSRVLNLSQVYQMVPHNIKKTFFNNKVGELCFTGTCQIYCTPKHAICGVNNTIAASLALLFPSDVIDGSVQNVVWYAPGSCASIFHKFAGKIDQQKSFLNAVDLSIFDFIQGNPDRHHYGKLRRLGGTSAILAYDNGLGFIRVNEDDFGLIAPLAKCCQIRRSTLEKLMDVHDGKMVGRVTPGDYNNGVNEKMMERVELGDFRASVNDDKKLVRLKLGGLGEAMRRSLQEEIVQHLLTDAHLVALDRRLVHVLQLVYGCLKDKLETGVIIDDGY